MIWVESMNFNQRLIFTLNEALQMPARMLDAIQYIPTIKEELKSKYGDNKRS